MYFITNPASLDGREGTEPPVPVFRSRSTAHHGPATFRLQGHQQKLRRLGSSRILPLHIHLHEH